MFQSYSYFFLIIIGIISLFAYIFCNYFADFSIIELPFTSKRIKFYNNKKNLIKFSSNQTNIRNTLVSNKNIITVPKYFSYSKGNENFTDEQIINKEHIFNSIDLNDNISKSVTNAFINNKKMLFQLEQLLYKFDLNENSQNLFEILCNYHYPINIVMKFCNINEKHMFYIQNNNIIKISNTQIYDKICNFCFSSKMFIIKDIDNTYISNGFIIDFKINQQNIKQIFENYYDNKYSEQLNKYNNLVIIIWASTIFSKET